MRTTPLLLLGSGDFADEIRRVLILLGDAFLVNKFEAAAVSDQFQSPVINLLPVEVDDSACFLLGDLSEGFCSVDSDHNVWVEANHLQECVFACHGLLLSVVVDADHPAVGVQLFVVMPMQMMHSSRRQSQLPLAVWQMTMTGQLSQ